MARKRFDPKAKAKKQKIVAAVLGVLFLGVMAYQAPTILGLFGGGSSEVASEPAPTAPAPAAPAPGTPAAPPAGAPAAGSAQLVDSDPAPQAAVGQLVTFDRFESKDPFAQQGEADTADTGAGPAPADDGPAPGLDEGAPEPEPTPSPPVTTETAQISVNGVAMDVKVGGTFPSDDPIFTLVSLTAKKAKIGIVDGTYATGAQTITLVKGGKPVTLMNTAEGTTYVLRLVAVK
jgi:hypothetical protein